MRIYKQVAMSVCKIAKATPLRFVQGIRRATRTYWMGCDSRSMVLHRHVEPENFHDNEEETATVDPQVLKKMQKELPKESIKQIYSGKDFSRIEVHGPSAHVYRGGYLTKEQSQSMVASEGTTCYSGQNYRCVSSALPTIAHDKKEFDNKYPVRIPVDLRRLRDLCDSLLSVHGEFNKDSVPAMISVPLKRSTEPGTAQVSEPLLFSVQGETNQVDSMGLMVTLVGKNAPDPYELFNKEQDNVRL